MGMIRGTQAKRAARDAVVLDLGDLQRQGQVLIARAQAQADQILAEAREQRQQIINGADKVGHAQGYERGLGEGREAGLKKAMDEALERNAADIERLVVSWSSAFEEFEASRQRMLLETGEDVLVFAMQIARKVTHRVVEHDPSVVIDQIKAVLPLVIEPTGLRISVHPEDVTMAQQALEPIMTRLNASASANIVEDAELSRGSCVVHSPAGGGMIDASIGTQLDRIAEQIGVQPGSMHAEEAE